ncbi:MAG: DUF1592 domain-containing protein [Rubripirellula sp.]|nr:DUF1592 domain-containing protein [Rubripirellula sp.]
MLLPSNSQELRAFARSLLIACCFIAVLASSVFNAVTHAAESAIQVAIPKATIQPFLQLYCVRCHRGQNENGQVRFDTATWMISTGDEAQRWQDVLDTLNSGDMPPEDEKQPTNDELSKVLDAMTGALITARRRLTDHGGEIVMRRLNRREYANTIRELFGFTVPEDMIPEDGEAATFDTVGDEQFFNSSDFEKYLALGREIADQAVSWAAKPRIQSSVMRIEPEQRVTNALRVKLADLDNKMRMKKEGKTWQEMGFKDEGEMKIVFQQFKNRAGKPRTYLAYPLVESGVYFVDVNNSTKRFVANRGSADPRGFYQLRSRAGIVGEPPSIRTFFRVTDKIGTVGIMKVQGTADRPQIIEMNYQPKMGQRNVNLGVEENRADIRVLDGYLKRIDRDGQWAAIWMDWLEIEGPFYKDERAFVETLLHPEPPPPRGRAKSVWSDENVRDLIDRLAFEAFRRQIPASDYIDRLVALYQVNRTSGQSFDKAISEVIGVILASPQFLFIQEPGNTQDSTKRQLTNVELAIRLSYFLWSGPPDTELYDCAKTGALSRPQVLHSQVERMLSDPRSGAFFDGFVSQWADLERFDAVTVDEQANFRFNKGVRHSAKREVVEFFTTLVNENLSVANLIQSDFVVINELLGDHYEIPGAESDQFQKVTLPADSSRGGLLGQTAILTLGSNGERSSPVIRGAWVMEKLLHDKPAPPPPNVPELGSTTNRPASNRQLVELHQKQAVCASCHKKMDVIGFGLENFDTTGRWRETEQVDRKEVTIQSGGKLPGGAVFTDVRELKTALLQEQPQLAEELVESLLAYGLGRTVEFSDADQVEQILQRLKREDFPMRSMIHEITNSQLFHTK